VGQAQGILSGHEADLHLLLWLEVSLPQLHASGKVDISNFIADAVGGVELANIAHLDGLATNLNLQLAAGDFVGRKIGGEPTGRYFAAPVTNGLVNTINKVL
jgi:hypothetical protein